MPKIDLKPWHKAVCERDRYICQKCKISFNHPHYFNENDLNQWVCGHHVKTRKAWPELTLDVSNGITVCKKCHSKIHNGELK